jgi:hypothetical protein
VIWAHLSRVSRLDLSRQLLADDKLHPPQREGRIGDPQKPGMAQQDTTKEMSPFTPNLTL